MGIFNSKRKLMCQVLSYASSISSPTLDQAQLYSFLVLICPNVVFFYSQPQHTFLDNFHKPKPPYGISTHWSVTTTEV